MESLDYYMSPKRYTWRCGVCHWAEQVKLYLRPSLFTRNCPHCGHLAHLTDEVIERKPVFTTG